MRSARNLLCTAAAVLLTSQMTSAPQAQQREQAVECVERTAKATPPPHPPPHARRPSSKGERVVEEKEAAPVMEPVCPEGQVPAVKEIQIDREVPQKGNPLLRPRSSIEGGGVLPGDVRSFREIYGGKRTKKTIVTPACAGVSSFGNCFYYASAGLTRANDGGCMTMSVQSPKYDNSGGPGHSLDEISVQGGPSNGNIVELGWLVGPPNTDTDPHIFVFHWKNWTQTCYNGCGWKQYSSTYFPGQNIKSLIGREINIGYVFNNNNWWAWFDGQYIGYFPGTEWNNSYTKGAVLQWFGEVASLNGIPPKTQMGDGVLPPASAAAHMFQFGDFDAKAWKCSGDDPPRVATKPQYYDIQRVGFGETRYGGPGQ